MTDLHAQARAWLADEVSDRDAVELEALLAGPPTPELADRFAGGLTFGTAGLRGPLRAGPNGMNAAVVRRAAAGIGRWLAGRGGAGARVVIGHDARHRSPEFAHDSAAVLAAAGFDVEVLGGPLPTPVLAFAVRDRAAAVGIMVTASHNPAKDNGYKVYLGGDARLHNGAEDAVRGGGAQIVPPVDAEIEAAISATGATRDILMSKNYTTLDDAVVERYVAAVVGTIGADAFDPGNASLRVVHTALHGVGWPVVHRVFERAGFHALVPTPAQRDADPDFPTVAFPNPEEAGALDLALATAVTEHADLVLANDPDADRCALAVVGTDGAWRRLTGDELGLLLADALLQRGAEGTFATTIVSSTMLGQLVAGRAAYAETLTGFKWIVRAADRLAFGYEEALGYAVAPDVVRDKDGISAGLLAAVLTRELLAAGSSPAQRLDDLAAEFGVHATAGISIRVADLADIGGMMVALRNDPPAVLAGRDVVCEDLLPRTDGLRLTWADGRAVVRPSGTEPKLKIYLEVRHAVGPGGVGAARAAADAALTQIGEEVRARVEGAVGR